jgi:hypothetical protein
MGVMTIINYQDGFWLIYNVLLCIWNKDMYVWSTGA